MYFKKKNDSEPLPKVGCEPNVADPLKVGAAPNAGAMEGPPPNTGGLPKPPEVEIAFKFITILIKIRNFKKIYDFKSVI